MRNSIGLTNKVKELSFNLLNNIVWVLLVLGLVIMGLFDSSFFSPLILKNIIIQTAVLGVLTAGQANVLLVGEIDLSNTGILAFSAGLGTFLMMRGMPWAVTIIFIIALGTGFGWINGILITKLKAKALIETLAMGIILQGALMALTLGKTIVNFPEQFTYIGSKEIIGIPLLPIPFFIIYILIWFMWNKTIPGRKLYAVGGNPVCAEVSGINVDRVKIMAFTLSGALAGISGYLLSAYISAVTMTFGQSLQMYTLAAAVIGGVSLAGGRGRVSGVLGGVLLITVIQVGLQILGLNAYYVTMVSGLMIFFAVIVDAIKTTKLPL